MKHHPICSDIEPDATFIDPTGRIQTASDTDMVRVTGIQVSGLVSPTLNHHVIRGGDIEPGVAEPTRLHAGPMLNHVSMLALVSRAGDRVTDELSLYSSAVMIFVAFVSFPIRGRRSSR